MTIRFSVGISKVVRSVFAFFGILLFVSPAAGQGIVSLNNRTPSGDIRIFGPDGTGGPGKYAVGATAQLLVIEERGEARTALLPATNFRTDSAATSFFVVPVDVVVPGYPPGSEVTLVLRAWLGSSYWSSHSDSHLFWGESAPFRVTLGGTNSAGQVFPIPALTGMTPFTIRVLSPPSQSFFDSLSATADHVAINLFHYHNSFQISSVWVLESSSNLQEWSPVLTNLPVTTSVILSNGWSDAKSGFFRMRLRSQ
jgi:hypothetical protein